MENILLFIAIGVFFYILYKKNKLKLDDAAIGVDNPYYDNTIHKTHSDKYKEELEEIFDYNNIKTTPLYEDVEENVVKNILLDEKDIDKLGRRNEEE